MLTPLSSVDRVSEDGYVGSLKRAFLTIIAMIFFILYVKRVTSFEAVNVYGFKLI